MRQILYILETILLRFKQNDLQGSIFLKNNEQLIKNPISWLRRVFPMLFTKIMNNPYYSLVEDNTNNILGRVWYPSSLGNPESHDKFVCCELCVCHENWTLLRIRIALCIAYFAARSAWATLCNAASSSSLSINHNAQTNEIRLFYLGKTTLMR